MSNEHTHHPTHEPSHATPEHPAAGPQSGLALDLPLASLAALVRHPAAAGRGNGPQRRAAVQRLQGAVGNRAARQVVPPAARPRLAIQRLMDVPTFRQKAAEANDDGKLSMFTKLKPLIRELTAFHKMPCLLNLELVKIARAGLPLVTQTKYTTLLTQLDAQFLDYWTDTAFQTLVDDIVGVPTSLRFALLNDLTIRPQIQARPADEATGLMSALLTNAVDYTGSGGTSTLYTQTMDDNLTGQVPEGASVNCFEFVMYSAQLAGNLDRAQLLSYFNAEKWGSEVSYGLLGWTEQLPEYPSGGTPQIGDLIFVTNREYRNRWVSRGRKKEQRASGGVPEHVILYVGDGRGISHDGNALDERAQRVDLLARYDPQAYIMQYNRPPW